MENLKKIAEVKDDEVLKDIIRENTDMQNILIEEVIEEEKEYYMSVFEDEGIKEKIYNMMLSSDSLLSEDEISLKLISIFLEIFDVDISLDRQLEYFKYKLKTDEAYKDLYYDNYDYSIYAYVGYERL